MNTITITVDGQQYDTVLDEHGVQRFVSDGFVCWLFDGGHLDLNEISIAYRKSPWPKRGYQEFHMALGYSVCGFADLWPSSDIKNTLWHAAPDATC